MKLLHVFSKVALCQLFPNLLVYYLLYYLSHPRPEDDKILWKLKQWIWKQMSNFLICIVILKSFYQIYILIFLIILLIKEIQISNHFGLLLGYFWANRARIEVLCLFNCNYWIQWNFVTLVKQNITDSRIVTKPHYDKFEILTLNDISLIVIVIPVIRTKKNIWRSIESKNE